MFGDSNADKLACIFAVAQFKTDRCVNWPWGKHGKDGYGCVWYEGQCQKVHRLVCEIAHGPPPPGKELALHSCDNPSCVNPNHLRWGDHQDNALDRERRNRGNHIHSAAHHSTILVEDDVLHIRELAARGEPYADLGRSYGVSPSTISQIARGLSWKHVGGPIVGARR